MRSCRRCFTVSAARRDWVRQAAAQLALDMAWAAGLAADRAEAEALA